MAKNKPHKGLLKRSRITKSGRIKLQRACGRHLRSHKPKRILRRYRRPLYAAGPDAKRLGRVLLIKVRAARVPTPADIQETADAASA
ncbi:MAG: large ribosomal subunit protein bL35 [Planctomycetota bacterium]|jgi:ribosomal protein L35